MVSSLKQRRRRRRGLDAAPICRSATFRSVALGKAVSWRPIRDQAGAGGLRGACAPVREGAGPSEWQRLDDPGTTDPTGDHGEPDVIVWGAMTTPTRREPLTDHPFPNYLRRDRASWSCSSCCHQPQHGDRPVRSTAVPKHQIVRSVLGTRMDRHAATRRLKHLAATAGIRMPKDAPAHAAAHVVRTMLDAGAPVCLPPACNRKPLPRAPAGVSGMPRWRRRSRPIQAVGIVDHGRMTEKSCGTDHIRPFAPEGGAS
jgi:hypothetical protein